VEKIKLKQAGKRVGMARKLRIGEYSKQESGGFLKNSYFYERI
jgi:hypothetical protein